MQEKVHKVATSAVECLVVLNALKYKLDRVKLDCFYVAFNRSKLEYPAIVWDSSTQEVSDFIENVQHRAGKIVSGVIHRTNKELVYTEFVCMSNIISVSNC